MPARPFGRSLADFGTRSGAEQKLLKCCVRGDDCVIAEDRPEADEKTAANTVRAAFLRFLILGGDEYNPVHERGVRVFGAWIDGELVLDGVASTSHVCAVSCWFDQTPILLNAHIKGTLLLSGSRIPGLFADGLTCDANLFCRKEFLSDGEVRLMGAAIGGDLACGGAKLIGLLNDGTPSGNALSAEGINVRGSVFLDDGIAVNGTVRLIGAAINGSLSCNGATFNGPLADGKLGGDAMIADGISVKGRISFNNKFTANGEVRFLGAVIGGNLECRGATFNGPLNDVGPAGNALSADGINVNGAVFLSDKFTSNGEVRLLRAAIGADLACRGATFNGPLTLGSRSKKALNADGINVKGSIFLDNGFTANGNVQLTGATIGGVLSIVRAAFNTQLGSSIIADGMSVAGTFFLRDLVAPVGLVSLVGTRVSVLADDEAAWGENLILEGFTYERIGGPAPKDAKTRRKWLDKQRPPFSGKNGKTDVFQPQPWLQLRKVLRESGHAEDARRVGIAFEDRRRHCGQITGVAKFFHWIYSFFTGYGYRPVRLLYWSLGVWLVCGVVYDGAAYSNVFVPTDSAVYEKTADTCPGTVPVKTVLGKTESKQNWVFHPPFCGHYPAFHPFAYSLNVFLPVVQLGQKSAWAPSEKPFSPVLLRGLFNFVTNTGSFVQLLIWVETLLGWFAGLLLVAVVSGLVRKQDD